MVTKKSSNKIVKKAAKKAAVATKVTTQKAKQGKAAKTAKPAKAAKPSKPIRANRSAPTAARPGKPVAKAPAGKVVAKKPAAKPASHTAAGALTKVAKVLAKALSPAGKTGKSKATPAKATQRKAATATKAAPESATKSSANRAARPISAGKSGPRAAMRKPAPAAPVDVAAKRTGAQKESVSKGGNGHVAVTPRGGGKVGVAVPPGSVRPSPVKGKRMPKFSVDSNGRPIVPPGYRPSADEEYMNPLHLEYFRQRLLQWRADLVEESKQTIENLREEVRDVGDDAERATRETENALELRTRDRYRKLIGKIDEAIKRIDDGSYGWCVDTGEEIGLERLEARLTAERTIDAQERWEHRQRQMGD